MKVKVQKLRRVIITIIIIVELLMKLHLTAMGCNLPYGITQCYLPPNTSKTPLLNQARGRYSTYLPRKDGRLS